MSVISKRFDALIPILFGVSAFLLVMGPWALNPQNVSWIHGLDPQQHYFGWVFYRQGPWSFPLGLNPDYGLSISSSIAFSDSIPIFAFIFKALSPFLPERFQYLGLWTLLCFVLQAWFAWKLVGLIVKDRAIQFFAMGVLVFSPPMLFRVGFHTSLVAHFLLLAALYLIFRPNQERRSLYWGLLIGASLLIHFYLFLMVFALWLADLADGFLLRKTIKARAVSLEIAFVLLLTLLLMWQAGYFISAKSFSVENVYGLHALDPLSLFSSNGWSYVLKNIEAFNHSYEGFVFLGLGGILLILITLPVLLSGDQVSRGIFSRIRHGHLTLFICLLFLFAFAITHSIKLGDWQFVYSIPPSILYRLNMIRMSARMFWPIFYLLLLLCIYCSVKGYGNRVAKIILGLVFFAQIIDTSAAWYPNRQLIGKHSLEAQCQYEVDYLPLLGSSLQDPFWAEAAKHYKRIELAPLVDATWQRGWSTYASYAAKYHLATNSVYLARIDGKKVQATNQERKANFVKGQFDANTLYILEDELIPSVLEGVNPQNDLLTRIDGANVLAPGWRTCKTCSQDLQNLRLTDLVQTPEANQVITFGEAYKPNFLTKKPNKGESTELIIPCVPRPSLRHLPFNLNKRNSLLTSGWFIPEEWGVWAEDQKATLLLPLPASGAKSIQLEARAFVVPKHPVQTVAIWANGVFIKRVELTKGDQNLIDIPIPAKSLIPGYVSLEFELLSRARPRDLGYNQDDRYLSMALVSARFR
jgi:hypothetical protein